MHKVSNNLGINHIQSDPQLSSSSSNEFTGSNAFSINGNQLSSSTNRIISNTGIYSFGNQTNPISPNSSQGQFGGGLSNSNQDSRLMHNISPTPNHQHNDNLRTSPPIVDNFLQVNGLVSPGDIVDLTHQDLIVNNSQSNPNLSTAFNNSGNTQICRYFANGNCMRGDRCNFSHIRSNDSNGIRGGTKEISDKKIKDKNKRFINGNQKANPRRGKGIIIAETKKSVVDGMYLIYYYYYFYCYLYL